MRLGEKASQVQKNMKINKTANMQRSPKVSLTLGGTLQYAVLL